MKKETLFLFSIVLFFFYGCVNQNSVIAMYKVASTSNEPTLEVASKVLVTKIFDIEPGDFVLHSKSIYPDKKSTNFDRVVGQGGDTIEIVKGVLLVNGKNFDVQLNLKHRYRMNVEIWKNSAYKDSISRSDFIKFEEMVVVNLTTEIAQRYSFQQFMALDQKGKPYDLTEEVYGQNWNLDFFGPLVLPEGKFFVMGDNRHNSIDSRMYGMLSKTDIIGKVILE